MVSRVSGVVCRGAARGGSSKPMRNHTRRAQGADLHHGCIYMDQLKRVATRGYAYVAASRFKSKSGCFLYGKLRVSDFLPVGEPRADEVTERGYYSESDEDDGEGRDLALEHRNPVLCGGIDSDEEPIPLAPVDDVDFAVDFVPAPPLVVSDGIDSAGEVPLDADVDFADIDFSAIPASSAVSGGIERAGSGVSVLDPDLDFSPLP